MSIFNFFSRDDDDEEELMQDPADRVGRQPDSAPSGELYEGMRLDVMTREGDPLLSGRIVSRTEDTLTLGRLPGELSFKVSTLGSEVSLSGYDKKLLPICLSATIQESTRTSLVLKNLKIERHAENRETFRLPCNAPLSLYRKDDENFRNPEACQLVNISIGGCCLQSEYIHMEDEVVRIRVKLEDYAPLTFLGQIVRCTEHTPGVFWYGILFAQLTEQEITSLNKTLYNLQMGIRDTHLRTEEGSWFNSGYKKDR